jgi:hypothetical protein
LTDFSSFPDSSPASFFTSAVESGSTSSVSGSTLADTTVPTGFLSTTVVIIGFLSSERFSSFISEKIK